jgi:hypothetical protein
VSSHRRLSSSILICRAGNHVTSLLHERRLWWEHDADLAPPFIDTIILTVTRCHLRLSCVMVPHGFQL